MLSDNQIKRRRRGVASRAGLTPFPSRSKSLLLHLTSRVLDLPVLGNTRRSMLSKPPSPSRPLKSPEHTISCFSIPVSGGMDTQNRGNNYILLRRTSKATHLCLCYLAAAVCIRAYMLSPCSAVAACLFWEQAQKAGRTLRYQRSLGVSAFRNERAHDAYL